mgnify:CR=1 FL=1
MAVTGTLGSAKTWAGKSKGWLPERLVFIDESGAKTNMTRLHAACLASDVRHNRVEITPRGEGDAPTAVQLPSTSHAGDTGGSSSTGEVSSAGAGVSTGSAASSAGAGSSADTGTSSGSPATDGSPAG